MWTRKLRQSAPVAAFIVIMGVQQATGEPFHHKFGELREYHRHWLAVCPDQADANTTSDYNRTCWASTHANKPGEFFDERLSVSRDRFNGEFKVRFVSSAYQNLDKSRPVTVKFSDGSTMVFPFGSSVSNTDSVNEFFLAKDNPTPLIAAMKNTNWMKLSVPVTDGAFQLTYSMIGLTAALGFTEKYAAPSN